MTDKPTPQEIVRMQLNAANAVCALAEHIGADPLTLAESLADGGMVELFEGSKDLLEHAMASALNATVIDRVGDQLDRLRGGGK